MHSSKAIIKSDHHGDKRRLNHKAPRKTYTGCTAGITISIRHSNEKSIKKDFKDRKRAQFPAIITLKGLHDHSLETANALRELRVLSDIKKMFNTYFEIGMNPTAASLYHLEKTNFQDLFGTANHSINPSLRTIQYLKDVWLKDHGGGFDNMTMLNMLNKYYEQNPKLTIKSYVTADGVFCIALITPFMRRVHEHMKEAGEIVFVDSISNSAD
ncbi:uncharacterized protein LOC135205589 [Macrobrachium nipponense]|uniref:uncharacterized protein LOC135205589 n=1 Tax=Macrobrachium nipponense TaxID=159736 RepID=UPI0030C8535F